MPTEYASYLKGNVNWTTNAVKLTVKKGSLSGVELWGKVTCHENISTRRVQIFATLYATGSIGTTEYLQTMRAKNMPMSGAAVQKRFTGALLPEATAIYNDEIQEFEQIGTAINSYEAISYYASSNGEFADFGITFRVQRFAYNIEVFNAEAEITIHPKPLNEEMPTLGAYNIIAHRDEKRIYGTVEMLSDEYLRPCTGYLYINKGQPGEITIPVDNPTGEIVYDSGHNITGYKLTYHIDHEHQTEINYTSNIVMFEANNVIAADHLENSDILIDWKFGQAKCQVQRFLRVQRIEVTPIESAAVGDVLQLYYTLNPSDAEIQAVTLTSSNTAVATIDDYGRITAISSGQVSFTVTSSDEYAVEPSTTITFFVRSDSFPTFANNYDFLTAQTTLDITSALNELAGIMGVTLGHSMLMFDMGYTTLKSMHPLLDAINENVKQLCTAAGISHTLPASVPYRNVNQTYYTMVNQWCRKIEAIHDAVT